MRCDQSAIEGTGPLRLAAPTHFTLLVLFHRIDPMFMPQHTNMVNGLKPVAIARSLGTPSLSELCTTETGLLLSDIIANMTLGYKMKAPHIHIPWQPMAVDGWLLQEKLTSKS